VAKQTAINPINASVGFDQHNNPTVVWECYFWEYYCCLRKKYLSWAGIVCTGI